MFRHIMVLALLMSAAMILVGVMTGAATGPHPTSGVTVVGGSKPDPECGACV